MAWAEPGAEFKARVQQQAAQARHPFHGACQRSGQRRSPILHLRGRFHFLDWQYTAFGEVVSGMEVADAVVDMKRDGRDNPLERVEMTVTITD